MLKNTMTTCYQWFSFLKEFSVKCPNCGIEARCSNAPLCKETHDGNHIRWERLNKPGIFKGDISCLKCGIQSSRLIEWPIDAFWTFSVKGKTLWAWNLEHTKVLLDFLNSKERNQKEYPGYFSALLHLPKHF